MSKNGREFLTQQAKAAAEHTKHLKPWERHRDYGGVSEITQDKDNALLPDDRLQKQIDYSIDLQRIIEAICHGYEIPKPRGGATHHYNMAVSYANTRAKPEAVGAIYATKEQWDAFNKALSEPPKDLPNLRELLSAPVVPDGYVLVDALTLQKAKCLIRFHVRGGACIDIDDHVYNALDIYGELNRLWLAAAPDKQPKGDE